MSITTLRVLLFSITCILFFEGFNLYQKKEKSIILLDEKIGFNPHEFYIDNVVDERDGRSYVAALITNNTAHASVIEKADLQGGAATAIKQFVNHNLPRNPALRPVVITLKEFKLTESTLPAGRVNGHLSVVFSFDLQLKYYTVHLMDYRRGIRYDRSDQQPDAAEPALRRGIEEALLAFNTWMEQQADNNALLATAVKVHFTDYTEKQEGDTIYYAVNRPLKWSDFQDKPRASRFEAEIFTSIGYTEQMAVTKGVININIALKVDLPKSDCWIRGDSHDDYILNHEQRHFDIEKLVAEHFKQKISGMTLPVENYDGPINVEYLETLREATRMQKQYDAETHHGMDRQAQEQWNDRIDKELKAYGVKK
jgi:hypothetical protein